MAKTKTDDKPGYSEEGMIGKAQIVVMTYRVTAPVDCLDRVADHLWSTFKPGTSAQRPAIGPRIENGAIVYTFHTIWKGEAAEVRATDDLHKAIAKAISKPASMVKVTMTYEAPAPLPEAVPGIDALLAA